MIVIYSIESILLTGAWISCFFALFFIPRKKLDRAAFIFLTTQFFSWILGLIVVQYGWLEYPVREFSKANATSFLFEFLMLPIIVIYFILNYPNHKQFKVRILYFAAIISAFTLIEFIIERYTMIIKYHAWKWYWTWISMSLVIYMVMVIYKWFYKQKRIFSI
ncbi:hypothetical protein Desor_2654 [Desulfosporosinus orientis DSM 765]|uniref:Uncharacterized protein n=2 Tax=Desulfosporosinus orientis TaxID=1563 RepID=G7W8Z2_DESOD|nr:CBO0543 family protein [Desulfosporosinus orientis]AET68201.1 hypothetical protein Desor_2654 [Desulfosporosinus orientis DSM 765]